MPLRTGQFEDGRGGFYADCEEADTWGKTERDAIDALVLLLEEDNAHLQAEVKRLEGLILDTMDLKTGVDTLWEEAKRIRGEK